MKVIIKTIDEEYLEKARPPQRSILVARKTGDDATSQKVWSWTQQRGGKLITAHRKKALPGKAPKAKVEESEPVIVEGGKVTYEGKGYAKEHYRKQKTEGFASDPRGVMAGSKGAEALKEEKE